MTPPYCLACIYLSTAKSGNLVTSQTSWSTYFNVSICPTRLPSMITLGGINAVYTWYFACFTGTLGLGNLLEVDPVNGKASATISLWPNLSILFLQLIFGLLALLCSPMPPSKWLSVSPTTTFIPCLTRTTKYRCINFIGPTILFPIDDRSLEHLPLDPMVIGPLVKAIFH